MYLFWRFFLFCDLNFRLSLKGPHLHFIVFVFIPYLKLWKIFEFWEDLNKKLKSTKIWIFSRLCLLRLFGNYFDCQVKCFWNRIPSKANCIFASNLTFKPWILFFMKFDNRFPNRFSLLSEEPLSNVAFFYSLKFVVIFWSVLDFIKLSFTPWISKYLNFANIIIHINNIHWLKFSLFDFFISFYF